MCASVVPGRSSLARTPLAVVIGDMDIQEFLLAILAAGGGGAAIALVLLRTVGEKWLDSRFSARLQDIRHEHERKMEAIRLDTSQSMDRFARLSEREFEVTAEAWSLVYETYVRTMNALPGFRQQADFSRLSDGKARIVAQANDFEGWEIDELLAQPQNQRNRFFSERKRQHEKAEARQAIHAATTFLKRKMLFLEKGVYEKLDEFVDWAWQAVLAHEIVQEAGPGNLDGITRHDEDFRRTAKDRVGQLEDLVRGRFWAVAHKVENNTAYKRAIPINDKI